MKIRYEKMMELSDIVGFEVENIAEIPDCTILEGVDGSLVKIKIKDNNDVVVTRVDYVEYHY